MPTSDLIKELIHMHTYRRPMGSDTEKAFRAKYINCLPNAEMDHFGNIHVTVGESRILWSCHTDTVHYNEGRQRLRYNTKEQILELADNAKGPSRETFREWLKTKTANQPAPIFPRDKSNCLGADDTAGVFICRHLILRGVPGHYVFHYGEERGGRGSSDLAKYGAAFLKQFDYAIALDRRGVDNIITYQGMSYTASDEFAWSLADELNQHPDLRYEPDDSGVYTDTKEYAGLIPECTNLSVGYRHEHSQDETLDCGHVLNLLDALTAVQEKKLVIARKAGDEFGPLWDDDEIQSYEEWLRTLNGPSALAVEYEFEEGEIVDKDLYLDRTQAEVTEQVRKELKAAVNRRP